jgi:hypothetical protein
MEIKFNPYCIYPGVEPKKMRNQLGIFFPKNEVMVNLSTGVSEKKVWISNPNFFTQELRAGSHYRIK